MLGIVMVSQGGLASELRRAAEKIAGPQQAFEAVDLAWEAEREPGRQAVAEAIARVNRGDGVIILTDMYGSTPYRLAEELAIPGEVGLVTGMNLPMVVCLGCAKGRDQSVDEAVEWLRSKGVRSICCNQGQAA